MFSMTTTELSTSIPTATARPDSEIILMVTPEKYISTTAKTTLMGMEHRVMTVGRRSLQEEVQDQHGEQRAPGQQAAQDGVHDDVDVVALIHQGHEVEARRTPPPAPAKRSADIVCDTSAVA